MRDEEKDLLYKHDKVIDTLSIAIEHLANTADSTNIKLDKVVDALNIQNVIIERMNNLDENLKESFGRVHKRIEYIESVQRTDGCVPLARINDKVIILEKSINSIEDTIKWINRVIIGAVLLGVLGTIIA